MLGSLQGRIGAVDDVTWSDRETLQQKRILMSTHFKTGIQFGFQPVTVSDTTAELLDLYIKYIRPSIMQNPHDPLFISFKGSKVRMGRLLSSFFKRTLGLNINSTTIRSIVETESEGLLLQGLISPAERESVLNINGHSGSTSKKYYQKRSITADVTMGEIVHQKLSRISTPSDDLKVSETPRLNLTHQFDETNEQSIKFGEFHPCINEVNGRRIMWTGTEVKIVGDWITNFLKLHPECNSVVSKCLNYIRKDSDVCRYFHPHHILDSTRLRYAWDKYREEHDIDY